MPIILRFRCQSAPLYIIKLCRPAGWLAQIPSSARWMTLCSFMIPADLPRSWSGYRTATWNTTFPNRTQDREHPKSLQLSLEICSEAAPSALDWKSDIFVEINDLRLGEWTSPSDFSDRRGNLTPTWWPDWNSQYGQLAVWRVDEDGSSVNGHKVSAANIVDLNLPKRPFIALRIGINDEAANKGGLNVFGRQFGNHPQDIALQIDY